MDLYKCVAYLLCTGADREFCRQHVLPKITAKLEIFRWMLEGESMPAKLQQWDDIVSVWLELAPGRGMAAEEAERLVRSKLIPIGEQETSPAYYLLTAEALLQVGQREEWVVGGVRCGSIVSRGGRRFSVSV